MASNRFPFVTQTSAKLTRRSVVGWAVGVAALGLAFAARTARADAPVPPFFIVVNAKNPANSVSREFLVDAFLKKASEWDEGETLRPVDQGADAAVRHVFSHRILKRSVTAVRRYWQQRIFSGREVPPPELDSDAAVLRYVANHLGAIGYVSAASEYAVAEHKGTKLIQLR